MKLTLCAGLVELDTGTGSKQEPSQNEQSVLLIVHEHGQIELHDCGGEQIVTPRLDVSHVNQYANDLLLAQRATRDGNAVTVIFGEQSPGGFAVTLESAQQAQDLVYSPDAT
jgi:hypothetical protein